MKKQGCGGCPRLKLVDTPSEPSSPEANNFWNTCPRKLDAMPTTPCSMGKPEKNKSGRIIKEPTCPWWVDSIAHNYCFWRYIQEQSLPNGKMDSLLQNEIATLLGCSSTKIHFVVKEAVKKLKDSSSLDALKDLAATDTRDGQEASSIPTHLGIEEDAIGEEPGE